jgi:hypothetical protein
MAVHGSVAVTTVTLALMTLASSEPWATAHTIGGNQDVLEHGDLQPARLQLRVHMALALTSYFDRRLSSPFCVWTRRAHCD